MSSEVHKLAHARHYAEWVAVWDGLVALSRHKHGVPPSCSSRFCLRQDVCKAERSEANLDQKSTEQAPPCLGASSQRQLLLQRSARTCLLRHAPNMRRASYCPPTEVRCS